MAIRVQMASSLRSTGEWTNEEVDRLLEPVEERSTAAHELRGILQPAVEERSTDPRACDGRARHVHDHDDPALPDMSHDHVPRGGEKEGGSLRSPRPMQEWNEVDRETWGELERLLSGSLRAFATTWRLRIEDFPRAVRAAIGETRIARTQGRVKKSVGGFLNDQFNRFKADIYGASGRPTRLTHRQATPPHKESP
jgi:hypothetical protein